MMKHKLLQYMKKNLITRGHFLGNYDVSSEHKGIHINICKHYFCYNHRKWIKL